MQIRHKTASWLPTNNNKTNKHIQPHKLAYFTITYTLSNYINLYTASILFTLQLIVTSHHFQQNHAILNTSLSFVLLLTWNEQKAVIAEPFLFVASDKIDEFTHLNTTFFSYFHPALSLCFANINYCVVFRNLPIRRCHKHQIIVPGHVILVWRFSAVTWINGFMSVLSPGATIFTAILFYCSISVSRSVADKAHWMFT